MVNITADYIHRSLAGLRRRPVLTVTILLLIAFGMAVFAVWLSTASRLNPRKAELFYVAGVSAADHDRGSICADYS